MPDPEPLISYILSCHGNQNQYILERYKEFSAFVKKQTDPSFHVTKDAGCFLLCQINFSFFQKRLAGAPGAPVMIGTTGKNKTKKDKIM